MVDIFCGAGGLSHGFRNAGFDIVGGIDIDEDCRYSFEQNNDAPFIRRDVATLTAGEIYGRMEWDAPAPTITTQFYGFGNGRFGHPEQDRAISLREGAILQSFPANYKFMESGDEYCFKTVGRLIGNAVPVRLGEVVGETIRQHLESRK